MEFGNLIMFYRTYFYDYLLMLNLRYYVDQSDPTSSLIAQIWHKKGDYLLIDGSGSTDGVWTNNIQFIWYITSPDNSVYSPIQIQQRFTIRLIERVR